MGIATSVIAANAAAARAKLGLPAKGRLILCTGSLGADQPLELLLQAAPLVMDAAKVVHFVVLGDGPQRSRVESETRRRSLDASIIFTGPVTRDDLDFYAQACDIGLFMTRSVGSSIRDFSVNDLFPFLAAGRPVVVASDNADAVCFVQVNNVGLASRLTGDGVADVAALAKHLTFLVLDDKARIRRGENARELGRQLHRTSQGGILDVVRATLRRAASL